MRIYCDMNIYNRCFDDQGQLRIRLETSAIESLFSLIEGGRFICIWSFILDYENSLNPFLERKQAVEIMSFMCKESVIPSDKIAELSKTVIKKTNISPRDALHLASAEVSGCKHFLTCDDRLIKKIKLKSGEIGLKIKPINPIDLIRKEVIKDAES